MAEPHTAENSVPSRDFDIPPAKRPKMDQSTGAGQSRASNNPRSSTPTHTDGRDSSRKGVAAIKPEFLMYSDARNTGPLDQSPPQGHENARPSKYTDVRMEDLISFERDTRDPHDAPDSHNSRNYRDSRDNRRGGRGGRGGNKNSFFGDGTKKERGQNKNRHFGSWHDKIQLCGTRTLTNEFSPDECSFGDKCRKEHNLRKYLNEGKTADLTTLDGKCPNYEARGFCANGWKCRFVGSHSMEVEREDGRKELVLFEDERGEGHKDTSIVNVIDKEHKIDLERRRFTTERADKYLDWLNITWNAEMDRRNNILKEEKDVTAEDISNDTAKAPNSGEIVKEASEDTSKDAFEKVADRNQQIADKDSATNEEKEDNRAIYIEPPFRPSEKRRIYYGPETPILAPLTTQGNLPFRRLCVDLGAQVTFSEMAMSLPLVQGGGSEWALMKAHESELTSPKVNSSDIVAGYDNSKDLKFGVQIAANKPWIALKATEILAKFCPNMRVIDLNCGCPIDLVYKHGAGSALLDAPGKLEKILRGMNTLSGEVPITAKIRMGTKDKYPNADAIVNRLMLGGFEANELGLGPSGVAAITLHGRSRQQRYSRLADWGYISDIAALIKRINTEQAAQADTVKEVDARDKPNGGKVFFVGNGDCYSHIDYQEHIAQDTVDSVMIARGALIKPWLFEEITSGQYLDKSATERLAYIEKFVRYGLETWGADEMGVGTTRRFLLEWLSFSCRYVPIGILEHLPPRLNERPPAFKGRSELEDLLSSDNYRDWIKISEMFLGAAHKDFKFQPKHKSNSYDLEAEG